MSNKVKRDILLTLTILSLIFTILTINNIAICIFAIAMTIILGINTRRAITACIEEQKEQDTDLDEDDDPVVDEMIKNINKKKCKYCMSDIDVDAKICPHCRKSQKKASLSNIIIGTIIGLVLVFVILPIIIGINNNNSLNEGTKTVDKELNDRYLEYVELKKTFCGDDYSDVSYSALSRNPDDYDGDCIHFVGKVIQVLEDFDENQAQLRVNTKLSNYSYAENTYVDDTIYVYIYNYNKNNRILEDDIIDIYGTSEGIITYESIMGASISIPSMLALKYEIK